MTATDLSGDHKQSCAVKLRRWLFELLLLLQILTCRYVHEEVKVETIYPN